MAIRKASRIYTREAFLLENLTTLIAAVYM
jgi:hypothetical protein